jgi:hypothetical protein
VFALLYPLFFKVCFYLKRHKNIIYFFIFDINISKHFKNIYKKLFEARKFIFLQKCFSTTKTNGPQWMSCNVMPFFKSCVSHQNWDN